MKEEIEVRKLLSNMRNMRNKMMSEQVSPENAQLKTEEENSFKEAVGVICSINDFVKDDKNVVLTGIIQASQQIGFKFSLEQPQSFFISTTNLQLDDATMEIINKTKAYYDNWYDKWLTDFNGTNNDANINPSF
jgi:hypothetical protein